MAATLPAVPRLVFTILEPISLVAGFVGAIIDPVWFVTEQVPQSTLEVLTPGTRMVALQLGNLYLLLAMAGVAVLWSTTEAKVVRNYIIALLIADVGHVGITGYVMGYDKFVDYANWNSLAWGNIGATAALFAFRVAYLLGMFGPDKLPVISTKKLQ